MALSPTSYYPYLFVHADDAISIHLPRRTSVALYGYIIITLSSIILLSITYIFNQNLILAFAVNSKTIQLVDGPTK